MATNKQDQAKAICELWDVILQHRWRFVLPAFAITALVLFASLFLPRKYEATAHFERRNAPELMEAIRSGASESYMDPIQSLSKEIAGSAAIAKVVTDLEPRLKKSGYIETHAELQALRTTVKQKLLVHREYVDKSRIQLRLELVLDDPGIAALIVNGLVDHYITTTRSAMVDRAKSSIAYYDQQIAEHRTELEKMQQELGLFEQKHAILLPEQPYNIQSQIRETTSQLSGLKTDLERLDIRRRTLEEAMAEEPATLSSIVHGQNPELIRLQLKMEEHQEKISDHINTQRMTEEHPTMLALRSVEAKLQGQIDATQKQIVTSTQDHPNPKRGEIELDLKTANGEREAIQEQIALRNKKIEELQEMSTQMQPARSEHRALLAGVDKWQKDVDYYQNIRRGAENYLTPETGDRGVQLEFIKRADAVRNPVSPNLVQVMLIAGFLGLASGALSVFLAHRTDASYRNARQLAESTTIPVMGSVSELITRQHQRVRKLRYSILYPANAVVMASILVLFAGVLYLDLERPEVLNRIKDRAKSMVISSPEQSPTPPASVGVLKPDDQQG